MANRVNVAWMRQRWACRETDPGRGARQASPPESDSGGGQVVAAAIKQEFLRRPVVIDCPRPGCIGMLLPDRREITRPGGARVRIVLRCTREPQDHDFVITMDPYAADEAEQLNTKLRRGEQPVCPRCSAALEFGSLREDDGWGNLVEIGESHYCPWCGVRWSPPDELKGNAPEGTPHTNQ